MARPRVYAGLVRYNMARLVRSKGLTGARRILSARGVNVSLHTLSTIAKENGIQLKMGRPAA